jgi:hypothetical protein
MGEPQAGSAQSPRDAADLALERCDKLIADYEKYWRPRKKLYMGFQSAAVLLAGLTPILLLTEISRVLQALPAAIASILGALVAIYHWQDNVARTAYASELLQSAQARFNIDRYNDNERALKTFVDRVENIRLTEVSGWRAAWEESSGKDEPR